MRPRRTVNSTTVFHLRGGTEDNELWSEIREINGKPAVCSLWVPTKAERKSIAAGCNIELAVYGVSTPPASMIVTDQQPKTAWRE